MAKQNIRRLILGGLIPLFVIAVPISAVMGQPSEEDQPRTVGLPGAVAYAAAAPDPPHNLTVIASIATAQENSTSTPPTMEDTEGPEGQGAAAEAPSRPGRPSVSGITHNSITLSWGAVSGATHYDAQYRDRDGEGPGEAGSWSQTSRISGTSYTFSGLTASTRYEFEIRATNSTGISGWSPKRYGTTTARPTPLTLPDPSDRTLTKRVSTSFTLPLARGGNAPYTHSVRDGDLPAGLSFTASSRTVSGEPTSVGTSTVRYSVTDSSSPKVTKTQTFTITVINEPISSAPGRPSASGITHNSVTLSWVAVTGATHYDARYRDRDAEGSDLPGSWSQTNGISGTSQTFSGLTASNAL